MISAVIFAALICYYIHFYSFSFSVNSDNAYFIRAAEDMLSGNILLKNWSGGFFTALTGDLLWITILRSLLSRKAVLYLVGPLSYSLIVICSFLLMKPAETTKNYKIAGICLLPILFIPSALRHPLITVGMHGIAITYILLLFFLTEKITMTASKSKKRFLFILFFVVSVAGCIADGYVIYYFALPFILAVIIRQFQSVSREEIKLSVFTLIAILLGKGTAVFLNQSGYLKTGSAATELTPIQSLPGYFQNTFNTWLRIFGFTASEFEFSIKSIPQIAGAVSAMIVLMYLVMILIRYFKLDLTTQALVIAFAFAAGSFTLTTVTKGEPAVRYLSPAFFFGLILMARQLILKPAKNKTFRTLALLPLVLFSIGNISPAYLTSPNNNQAYIEIAEALRDRGLKNGYATYWETHALNYYSDDKLMIAPVETRNGEIVPSEWASKSDWYESEYNAGYILVSQNKTYGLNEDIIVSTFGEFKDHIVLNETDIYIYDKNLSAALSAAD
ncbi:MAG: hypothetical protein AB9907_15295 [Flexilinea sp.]